MNYRYPDNTTAYVVIGCLLLTPLYSFGVLPARAIGLVWIAAALYLIISGKIFG